MTGIPSIDKPWLKYYIDKAVDTDILRISSYEHLLNCNKNNKSKYSLNYFGRKFTFEELFENINKTEKAKKLKKTKKIFLNNL